MDARDIAQELRAISKELSEISTRLQLVGKELGLYCQPAEYKSELDTRLRAAAASLLSDYQPGSDHIAFLD